MLTLDLASLLTPTLHSVATDDSRYGLNGVQFEMYPDDECGAVSTDGYRAVVHRCRMEVENPDVVLLPRKFCSILGAVAPGPVTLTWWRPLSCSESLSGLSTVNTRRLIDDCPLYRVHFDLGERVSQTIVRENGKISVVTEVRPGDATCTITTTQQSLVELLGSQVTLDDWLTSSDVVVTGDVSHLRVMYAEIGRSDMIRVEHPDGTVLTVRCLEGDFPNWRKVVPSRYLREAAVDRKALDEAVRYVMTAASEKTHAVRVSLRDGEVLLSASNPDQGTMSDSVPAETRGDVDVTVVKTTSGSGEEVTETRHFTIGLNGQYLRDELKALGGDRIEILFGDSLNPVVLRRPVDDSLRCVVMPMRLE